MHLLDAFINSTDVSYSNFASKRTHRQVTFTYALVGWMLNEGHVYFGMRTNKFRISFVWKPYGNYTRIKGWPAIKPKPDSERVADVGEHLVFPTVYQAKRSAGKYQSHGTEYQWYCRGQIQLEESM